MSESETLWHVQVEEGVVKVWSLDQLDAAFKAGLIDEATFVLEDGSSDWMTLGALLGGGDEEEEAPPVIHATQLPEAAAPVAEAAAPVVQIAQPIPVVAAVVAAPEQQAPVALSYAPPAPAFATQSGTPESLTPMSFSPQSSGMVPDLDDEIPASFRSSKKRGVVIALSLVAVAAAVAFGATRFSAAPAEAPVAAAAPPPVADTPSVPPSTTDVTPMSATPQRLTDEQRRALAEADKATAAKQTSIQKSRASSSPRHHGGKSAKDKGPFHNGGEAGDPLNGKL